MIRQKLGVLVPNCLFKECDDVIIRRRCVKLNGYRRTVNV